jgi:hypothetical protein
MSQDWNRYGPTAARAAGAKPGRMVRPPSITVDIHSMSRFLWSARIK